MRANQLVHWRDTRHPYAFTLLLVALCTFLQYKGRHLFGQRAPLGLALPRRCRQGTPAGIPTIFFQFCNLSAKHGFIMSGTI
ncbi:hypothetical protein [Massilia sp. X63]|jgi:hypothetical protein|uniref:hypothetical protein n=1 Tax=Massilia sp. X63 TaxID=3237285 RepID=UPI0034DD40E8